MGADIAEGPQLAVIVPGDNDLLADDVERHVVARLLDLLDAGDTQPILHEDQLFFLAIDLRRIVDLAGNMARTVDRPSSAGGLGGQSLIRIHVTAPSHKQMPRDVT